MEVIKIELVLGHEYLVSRSMAKSMLKKIEPHQYIVFDFENIESIGQAFADEIFRVYCNQHPDITISYSNAVKDVEKMIRRAK